MRKQLSAPVSLMLVVIGFALIYYVFHSNGWSWDGDASLGMFTAACYTSHGSWS